ncbi:Ppx/GppA phosphatase family protein [Helicobacter cetorum]|uniref:Guanosine-5'-triphosphate,3'-diphosphate pyrophosphatase n=1 Tax=Helicobacter cetorum (strain ATCC BAA-429 / MIT 00-7128) TaxID=182217 RepID=I0EMV1_HELC0|nr:Ppx/GppA phosphatase family protein [Helicobacter cetorum]AFI04270.1 guanosine-5'-triphosphate,3'-diphosphate pyrophosphatase [Helicobacter cetorum MIT 00-7128]
MAKITTVIDIGSNSVRLAVFKKTSQFGFYLLFEAKSRVRISEGCYAFNGVLQEIPMQRTIKALCEFKQIALKYKSKKILCVATSAVRDAPNAREFVARVKEACGIQIKVIDGQKEAFYGGIACANLLHKNSGITIDIGGGSTECALIEKGKIVELVSLDIGTIRIKELFLDKALDLKKARQFIQQEALKLPFKHKNAFGVGGTIRALSKVIMKRSDYPIESLHGYEMEVKKNLAFIEKIATFKEDKLRALGVNEERLDSIRSGALILAVILEILGTSMIITSGVGVREGVFLSDMLRHHHHKFPPNINPSLISLKDRFLPHEKHSLEVRKECARLFEVLRPLHKISEEYLFHLKIAGELASMGKILNFYVAHKHSAYFILNALNYGFSHRDRAIICLLAQFSHKKIPKDNSIAHMSEIMPDILTLQWLSFILSLAESLRIVSSEKLHYKLEKNKLIIQVNEEFYLAKEQLFKLIKPIPFQIEFI